MAPHRMFADRNDAAEALARQLSEYHGRKPLVLAIPRGAVPMGSILAERLQGELDLVLVRKLGSPIDPEYAIGAIDETGWVYIQPEAPDIMTSGPLLEQIKADELAILKKRRADYTPFMPAIDAKDRVAIVVDDGLATGATMIAALHATRAREPAELVCAVPVAATSSLEKVRPLADKVVCLYDTEYFGAVSLYYNRFTQVSDAEVAAILARRRPVPP
ncbi:MAG TPA: phosphoribosyltransferase family protein [Noviherbaspirillum sp.]|nr:phosphoribosyltransferase family protein [Noviherbaspirillum sp.]